MLSYEDQIDVYCEVLAQIQDKILDTDFILYSIQEKGAYEKLKKRGKLSAFDSDTYTTTRDKVIMQKIIYMRFRQDVKDKIRKLREGEE